MGAGPRSVGVLGRGEPTSQVDRTGWGRALWRGDLPCLVDRTGGTGLPGQHSDQSFAVTRDELVDAVQKEWHQAFRFEGELPDLPLLLDGSNARAALGKAQLEDKEWAHVFTYLRDVVAFDTPKRFASSWAPGNRPSR